jgi:hypothetical protein
MKHTPFTALLLSISTVFASPRAAAEATEACTPTERAPDVSLTCHRKIEGGARVFYAIVVETLASPDNPDCRGEKRVEHRTAKVALSDVGGRALGSFRLEPEEFQYRADLAQAYFRSDRHALDLKDCRVPNPGRFAANER